MGCDIHIYLEYNNGEKWTSADLFDIEGNQVPIYIGRDYVLFSILANVRNSSERFEMPISYPKGLPIDLSEYVKKTYSKENSYYHPHGESYLTLQELYNAITDDIIEISIPSNILKIYKSNNKRLLQIKDDKNNFVFTKINNIRRNEYIKRLINTIEEQLIDIYIYKYSLYCKDSVREKSDNIRIVFWFDN